MLKNLEDMRTHLNAQGEAAVEIENAALKAVEDHKAFVNWAMNARKHMRLKIEEVSAIISAHGEQVDDNFAELIDKSQLVIDTLEGNSPMSARASVDSLGSAVGEFSLGNKLLQTPSEQYLAARKKLSEKPVDSFTGKERLDLITPLGTRIDGVTDGHQRFNLERRMEMRDDGLLNAAPESKPQ